jgi:hypothetical protein
MLVTEDQLRSVSPKAWQRKRNITIIVVVYWLILFFLAVHVWTNLTVEYYGQAIAIRDLVGRTSALYCAMKVEPQWYRDFTIPNHLFVRIMGKLSSSFMTTSAGNAACRSGSRTAPTKEVDYQVAINNNKPSQIEKDQPTKLLHS